MLGYPKGLYTQYEANVGYYPHHARVDTSIHTGPGATFPEKARLSMGARFAVQSTRNPEANAYPPMRTPVNGYVMGYKLDGGETGWVRITDLNPGPYTSWADGPASVDFQVGKGRPRRKRRPRFTLGFPVRGRRRIRSQETYLRYAPHGTAFHFLHKGDVVQQIWRGRHYTGVRVVRADGVPKGTIGWVLTTSLG